MNRTAIPPHDEDRLRVALGTIGAAIDAAGTASLVHPDSQTTPRRRTLAIAVIAAAAVAAAAVGSLAISSRDKARTTSVASEPGRAPVGQNPTEPFTIGGVPVDAPAGSTWTHQSGATYGIPKPAASIEEEYESAPDFLPVSDKTTGVLAGFIRKTDWYVRHNDGVLRYGPSKPVPVYDSDLETQIGNFGPGGYVPLGPSRISTTQPSPDGSS